MNTAILLLFAIINVVVVGLFAGMVLRQYRSRRRNYQLYWSIGLTMAFLATLAYVLMVLVQPSSSSGVLLFRVYYILGGALVAAWLGLGSIALVASKKAVRVSLVVLCVLSVLATILIAMADIDMSKLAQIAGTPGTDVPQLGVWAIILLAVNNTLGVVAVVGVAIYSGWKMLRHQSSIGNLRASNLLWANVLILAGDLLNASAGTFARLLGLESTFWLIMTLGWLVFFIGVLLAGRRSSPTKPGVEDRNTQKSVASV